MTGRTAVLPSKITTAPAAQKTELQTLKARVLQNLTSRLSDDRHAWPKGFVSIGVKTPEEAAHIIEMINKLGPSLAKQGITVQTDPGMQLNSKGTSPFVRVNFSLDMSKVSKATQKLVKAGVDREVQFLTEQAKSQMSKSGSISRAVWSTRDLDGYADFLKTQVNPALAKQGLSVNALSVDKVGVETLVKVGFTKQ